VNDVYEENCRERINEYEKINYEELNAEENTQNKYTQITEYDVLKAVTTYSSKLSNEKQQ
jgi:hypothetical protein